MSSSFGPGAGGGRQGDLEGKKVQEREVLRIICKVVLVLVERIVEMVIQKTDRGGGAPPQKRASSRVCVALRTCGAEIVASFANWWPCGICLAAAHAPLLAALRH
jgi:hypothetical protein